MIPFKSNLGMKCKITKYLNFKRESLVCLSLPFLQILSKIYNRKMYPKNVEGYFKAIDINGLH